MQTGVIGKAWRLELDVSGQSGDRSLQHIDLPAANQRIGQRCPANGHSNGREQKKVAASIAHDIPHAQIKEHDQ